ncbi:DNA mismatch repair protein MutS [Desulfococcaceae bacterium HSG9]|nr:DNA mismatch repair protein MutS [Desulfococcaceae bacterium HSG9]
MRPSKITPMLKQYLTIKDKHPDAILFYRMGDFYEMFFEDAKTASRLLDITLTSRNKKDDTPIPMCGVPYRAAKAYIAKMIEGGLKVAVCDQVEDPGAAKGLVKREVVRVITPGTIIEDELLNPKINNYILAAVQNGKKVGIASLDISTGTFRCTESEKDPALEEIQRIAPSEIIVPESARTSPLALAIKRKFLTETPLTFLKDNVFKYRSAYNRLLDQFNTQSLDGFGGRQFSAGVEAAGALLFYVRETQKNKIFHITRLETYFLSHYLFIDDLSCRNLELFRNLQTGSKKGSLLSVIDRTLTPMGGRLLNNWLRYPLKDEKTILLRSGAVEETLSNNQACTPLRRALKAVYDLERLTGRITMGHGNARDLTALKSSLIQLPKIWSTVATFKSGFFHHNANSDFEEILNQLAELAATIDTAIRDNPPVKINEGGIIKSGYNVELDELVNISRDGKGCLARLEAEEKKATGIQSLKVKHNKIFGYYIEIPKARLEFVPAHYIRKQTLVNAERFITEQLKTFEIKVLGAEEQRAVLEYTLFTEIKDQVVRYNEALRQASHFLARLDCVLGLAAIADENNYSRPEINSQGCISIREGRHPVIEKMIAGERFVPNDIILDNHENQIQVITGPNMAGKSTILRQAALTVLMAQMGSFVPAEHVSLSLTDRIFTRVGALDNLSQGQSTFLVEMQETANILNNATCQSLIILDEIGRGTSTYDGLSLAYAVAEYLHDFKQKGVKTLFATHYHELTELAETKPRVQNYNIAVKEWNDEIIFLRKLVPGGTNRSYGIQVARLAGIPDNVIQRAQKILMTIENREQTPQEAIVSEAVESDGYIQLSLFRKPETIIIENLQKMDMIRTTPIEALTVLNELHEMALQIPSG